MGASQVQPNLNSRRGGQILKQKLELIQKCEKEDSSMNKSAIITKQNNLNLPDKLLKMKERVRRDKSANSNIRSQESEGRATSLYGR